MGTNANNIIDDMKKLFEELYKTYETKDEKRQKEIMSELENIYKDNKKTKRRLLLVLTYSSELSKLTNKQDTKEDIKETVDKLKGIYEENKEDMFVAMSYVEGLANLITKQDTKKDIEDTVRDLDTVYDYYKKIKYNKGVVENYAIALWNLTFKQDTKEDIKETVDKLEDVYKNNINNIDVARSYAVGLANLTLKQDTKEDIKETVDKLKGIYEENKENIDVARSYTIGLLNLTFKQETKEEIEDTVKKLKEIYENKENIDVARSYAGGLGNLTLKQETKEEIKETVDKLKEIYEYKENKDNIYIAENYTLGLGNLTAKQETKKERKETVHKLEDVYKNNNNDYYICNIYITVITFLYGKYIENLYNFLNNDKNFVKMILKYVDEKYINVYEENDNSLFCNIMKIWVSTKTILKNLILKEEDIKNNRFGQYIGAGTIKYFLKDIEQIKDNGKNINECRYNLLRLDNADYMNDPLEGKAFFKKFEHSDNDFIKDIIDSVNNEYNASSIYLRSLTENIDSLPMWISYGDSAKGCCVIYDNNFFDKDNIGLTTNPEGFYGINTKQILKRQQPDEIQEIDKIQSTAYSYCLYRVLYVEEDGTLKKEETKNVIDDVEKEIEDIKNLIVEIGDKLKNKLKDIILKKNIKNGIIKYITLKEMIKKEMITILDEIRYLFKSSDYEHEREVRLLICVPQDSYKIKLDKDRGVIPHIYVEDDRDSRKIIKEVIFGPKVENINEYIPYIKYCDNEVKIEKSKIRYR